MRQRRSGFTSIEIVLGILLCGVLFAGIVAWRAYVWAQRQTAWSREVYRWINGNDFQHRTGGGTDPVKPPPPDDL